MRPKTTLTLEHTEDIDFYIYENKAVICGEYVAEYLGKKTPPKKITLTISTSPFKGGMAVLPIPADTEHFQINRENIYLVSNARYKLQILGFTGKRFYFQIKPE